uniref:Uncharacterized protein n=1 Tax=viral metagenome TaxID=1070528 RepID=A0A6C0C7I6_9ZZZZ
MYLCDYLSILKKNDFLNSKKDCSQNDINNE